MRALRDGEVLRHVRVPGARGLADPGGADAARAAIAAGLAVVRREAGLPDDTTFDVLAVGAAGSEAAPDLGRALLAGLPARELVLTSDAITSHAGAFAGGAGAVVAIGTGAVAIGLGSRGLVRVDGLGYWLGDDGGGSWIGRRGLRHALDARAGRGPATSLLARAEARYGDLARLPGTLAAGDQVAAVTAAFAVDVVAAAESGDALALRGPGRRRRAPSPRPRGRGPGERRPTWSPPSAAWRPCSRDRLARPPARRPHRGRRDGLRPRRRRAARGADRPPARGPRRPSQRPAAARCRGWTCSRPSRSGADLADLDERPRPSSSSTCCSPPRPPCPPRSRPPALSIAAAVALAEKALLAGGRLLYVGAGTPGRLAAQDAAEIPPTFGTDPSRVVAILAGGGEAAAHGGRRRRGPAEAGRADLLALAPGPDDLVVGIAASGRTPYVLEALRAAREQRGRHRRVVNNPGSVIAAAADVAIEVLTGPEVLAGSTRMKAGTAQKVVLNVLSTSAMVRTGKSYGAWMVDLQASNAEAPSPRAVRMLPRRPA